MFKKISKRQKKYIYPDNFDISFSEKIAYFQKFIKEETEIFILDLCKMLGKISLIGSSISIIGSSISNSTLKL